MEIKHRVHARGPNLHFSPTVVAKRSRETRDGCKARHQGPPAPPGRSPALPRRRPEAYPRRGVYAERSRSIEEAERA
jgi:hypothetical protein